MGAFEDKINAEMPKRSVMLTESVTGYTGDPNAAVNATVNNAPQGSYYVDSASQRLWWKKLQSDSTSWEYLGTAGTGTSSVVIGENATAEGDNSVCIGNATSSSGPRNVILGNGAIAEGVASFGSANTVAASLLASGVDTDSFSIRDGVNPQVQFVFDDDASVVETPTLRSVPHTGVETADQIRDLIITAVTNAPALDITAVSGGTGKVDFTNDSRGAWNYTIVETVANEGFTVSGMGNGVNDVSVRDSVAIGNSAAVHHYESVVLGEEAISYSKQSVVIGSGAISGQSLQNGNVVIGYGASSSPTGVDHGWNTVIGSAAKVEDDNYFSAAIGYSSSVDGDDGLAFGSFAKVQADWGTALGDNAVAVDTECIALGYIAVSRGVGGICIGTGAEIDVGSGDYSICLGHGARGLTAHAGSIAIGRGAETTAASRCTVGSIGGLYDLELQIGGGLGVWGVAPPGAQPSKIVAPAGGATVDTEARTAVNAIIAVLEGAGLSSAS